MKCLICQKPISTEGWNPSKTEREKRAKLEGRPKDYYYPQIASTQHIDCLLSKR